ncbi:hypothetical protein FACS1894166_07990 [Bacilli bacterium]|nr:hypothetical protein FACS1894166_07990 [Bacilli bacterium]
MEKQMSFIETHSKFQNYVMILLKNNFHTIVSMYACLLLGRVCLVPPSEIGGNLLKEKCDSYHPDLLITEECYVADITHYNIDTPYTFYPQTFGTEKINYHNNLIQPNSPAVLFTTSGSTGTPKEFIVNHQYLTCQIRPDFLFFKTIYDSNIQFDCHRMLNELLVAPVNTTAGFAFQIVTCLALPQTVVIAKWTPKNFSEIIDLHDINVIYAIPKMFSLIEQYLASTGKTHSKLKLVIAGGGKWHETTLFQDYDILFAMTYGSSEAQCIS